jgi:hypothetical protein
MKVVGILVCNTEKVLRHKQQDGKRKQGAYCYWDMKRFPTRISALFPPVESTGVYSESAKLPRDSWNYSKDDLDFPEDVEVRLYFAIGGVVRGYFVCKAMGERKGVRELRFHSESWHPLYSIPLIRIKPSQGFRYFNHEEA